MQVDIRQPMIQGSDREQLSQIRSYLFQLRDQLQWAFENVEATGNGGGEQVGGTQIINTTTTVTRPPTEAEAVETFNAIKNLIIKSGEIVDAYEDIITTNLKSSKVYVSTDDYNADKVSINSEIDTTKGALSNYQEAADGRILNLELLSDENAKAILENANKFNGYLVSVEAKIKETAENITTEHNKIEVLSGVFQGDNETAYVRTRTGYIKTGFLTDKEYGVEIGQTEQGKDLGSARFTPQRIAFYEQAAFSEGEVEPAAWLSNKRLHVRELESVDKQLFGGFEDIVDKNTGTIITRWTAKEE